MKSRLALEMLEKLTEEKIQEVQSENGMLTKKGAIIKVLTGTHGGNEQEMESRFEELNRDLWSVLSAKAEGKAEEKMERCQQGEGLWAYMRIQLRFSRSTAQVKSVKRAVS